MIRMMPSRLSMTEGLTPYAFFLWVLALFVILGMTLQGILPKALGIPMHVGLIASEVICILLPAVAYRRMRIQPSGRHMGRKRWPVWSRLGLRPGALVLACTAAASLGITATLTGSLLLEWIPAFSEMAEAYRARVAEILSRKSALDMAFGILSVSVAAPVCEEFLFRGTLLPDQREPLLLALVLNGVLFASLHLDPLNFVPLLILGVFLAHLAVLCQSLWPPILAHATINTVNGTVLPWFLSTSESVANSAESDLAADESALALVIALAISSVLSAVLWKAMSSMIRALKGHTAKAA